MPDLQGFVQNVISDSGNKSLSPISTGTVAGIVNAANGVISEITLRVIGVNGLTFEQTFSSKDFVEGTVPAGWPSPSLLTAQKTASDGSVRSFAYIDPAKLGFVYSTLGAWAYAASPGAVNLTTGYFSLGFLTHGSDIPATGTGSYNGVMIGSYANGNVISPVSANASAIANFGTRTVDFWTTNTQRSGGAVSVAAPQLNLGGVLTYPAGTNSLTGNVGTTSGLTGRAEAGFYGPAAAEMGGIFFVNRAAEQMSGSFGLKR